LETITIIAGLIAKYIMNQINEHEREKLDQWINESESNRRLFFEITDRDYVAASLKKYQSIDTMQELEKMKTASMPKKVKVVSIKKWLIAAVIGTGLIILGFNASVGNNKDCFDEPGEHKARFKLADGTLFNLENWHTGIIARLRNYTVKKETESWIRYETVTGEWGQLQLDHFNSLTGSYDTLTTPRGGQYTITLPDGTDIWLSAASTLSIPASFSPDKRQVELSGEAFFNVHSSPGGHPTPFTVKAGNSTIVVMGTQFNIKAYDDEKNITATVVEGKVQIKAGKKKELLTSNQKARILRNDEIIKANVDAYMDTSWKAGYYQFNDEPLRLILQQASRWYDMEFAFFDQEVTEAFTVRIDRDKPIEALLKHLSDTRLVRFEVKGKKIIVYKPDIL
jgi:transmembrane sensor